MDAIAITLLTADGQALAMTSNDLTWITDWAGFNFPIEVREGEMLVVEAVSDEACVAFWREFMRETERAECYAEQRSVTYQE